MQPQCLNCASPKRPFLLPIAGTALDPNAHPNAAWVSGRQPATKNVGQPAGSAPCRRPKIDNVSQRPEPRGSDWNRNGLLHGSHSHAGRKPFAASGRGRQANAFSVARHSPPASTGRCSTSPSPEPVMTSHLSCARRNNFSLAETDIDKIDVRPEPKLQSRSPKTWRASSITTL